MNSIIQYSIQTPIGELWISCEDEQVVSIDFEKVDGNSVLRASASTPAVERELFAYFNDFKHRPELLLSPEGTPFQQRVWQALCTIPAGSVETYGSLAHKLNTSARAVGNACRANPIPVLIPCHRVVSASGLGGYMGETGGDKMDIKRWLLKHEGVIQ